MINIKTRIAQSSLCILLCHSLTARAQSEEICAIPAIFTYGKCPNVCEPLTLATFRSAFDECAPLQQFVCAIVPCTGPFSFVCDFDPSAVEGRVCPGDTVVFDSIDITKKQVIKYFVDLNAAPAETDMYILVDATGGVRTAVDTAKEEFTDTVKYFSLRDNVNFGLGFYRDEATTGLYGGFKNAQPLNVNPDATISAIKALNAEGGLDFAEANLVALYKVATLGSIGWRPNARKILIYFGVSPGHEPTCVPGFPELNRNNVGEALANKGISLVSVSFSPGLDNAPGSSFGCGGAGAGAGQLTSRANTTRGSIVYESDQALLIEAIQNSFKDLTKIFDVNGSECAVNIKSSHSPSLALKIEPGESAVLEHSIELKPDACRNPAGFECRFKYTESGADLPATTIQFVNIIGCS